MVVRCTRVNFIDSTEAVADVEVDPGMPVVYKLAAAQ